MLTSTPGSKSVTEGLPDLKRTLWSKIGVLRTSSTRKDLLQLKENITSIKSLGKTEGSDDQVISDYEKIKDNLSDLEVIRKEKGGDLTKYKSEYLSSLIKVAQTMLDERKDSYVSSLENKEKESKKYFDVFSKDVSALDKTLKEAGAVQCQVQALREDVKNLKETEFKQGMEVSRARQNLDEAKEKCFSALGISDKKVRVKLGSQYENVVITGQNAIQMRDASRFVRKIDSVNSYLGELKETKKALGKLRQTDSQIKGFDPDIYNVKTSYTGGTLVEEMDQGGLKYKGSKSSFDARNAVAKSRCEAAIKELAKRGIPKERMSIKETDASVKAASKYSDGKMYRYYQIEFHTESLKKDIEKCEKRVKSLSDALRKVPQSGEYDAFVRMVDSLDSDYSGKLGSDITTCSPSLLKKLKSVFSEEKTGEISRCSREVIGERSSVEKKVKTELQDMFKNLDELQNARKTTRNELEKKKIELRKAEEKRGHITSKPLKKVQKDLARKRDARKYWEKDMQGWQRKKTEELGKSGNEPLMGEGVVAKL